MTDHLASTMLSALADGELSRDQLALANEHLAGCPACTANALYQTLLKSATAKAGRRYAPPPHLQERLLQLSAQERSGIQEPQLQTATGRRRSPWRSQRLGWATAAVFLLLFAGTLFVQHNSRRAEIASVENAALLSEVFDQHIATLADSLPPQVLSTDRHTVKPWFQGKLPFSFNLPENLPRDTTLEGANLTYLRNQPVAQLLYSIGKHRVSVFVGQKHNATAANQSLTEHAGFHVMGFGTPDLEMTAISDVDPARLAELADAIRQAQTADHQQLR